MFVSTSRGNYRLQWVSQSNHSPGIDACSNGLSQDLGSNARPVAKITATTTPYDRGALESQ